ncbi:DUF5412 family protein [Paenibacillus sp. JDR-2]|uniref:DUF5412 family protein n=1 Tax=Paenibacillus sp. (strain JDR-2) TaxID=324057 RepID=UPI0001AAF835|nr:DUF5412 family protein [Paenibacillus sp. JDR-2]ACT01542.1 hypothetical protein Pjdr2_2894 [Paenibacillus sp. JDR-2]
MKKRYIIIILLFFGILMLIGYNRYSYKFKSLDNATLFLGPIESPDGKYEANSYYINYGGAAGGVMYIVEVEQTRTGEKKKVYSSNHKNDFSMSWKASDILSIKNESPKHNEYRNIDLNVITDIYEESGAACRSFLLKENFENCYKAEDIKEPLIFKLLGF